MQLIFGDCSSSMEEFLEGSLDLVGEQSLEGFAAADHMSPLPFMSASMDEGCPRQRKRKDFLDEHEILSVRKYECIVKQEYRRRRRLQKRVQIVDLEDAELQASKKETANQIVQYIMRSLSGYDKEDQRDIMQEVLGDQSIGEYTNRTHDHSISLANALRCSLQLLKNPKSNDELFLKRSTLTMLVNGLKHVNEMADKEISLLQVSKFLNIHPRNMYAAMARVEADEGGSSMLPLHSCKRKATCSRLTSEVKEIAIQFWTEQTRVSPNKKDIIRRRLGYKHYTEHPVHFLDDSQTEYFNKFKQANPHIQIGQRSFEKLKPWFVRKLNGWNTCCCIYHVELIYLKDSINHLRLHSFGFHGQSCTCNCVVCKSGGAEDKCQAQRSSLSGITQLWQSCVCAKKEDSPFHQYNCLMGNCKKCGVNKLEFCPHEVMETTKTVPAQIFEDIQVENRQGEQKRRKILSLKQLSIGDLVKKVKVCTKTFIKHNFTYRWQADQYKECLKTFSADTIVSVTDFAENYSFKEQNEIQSMHWHTDQCTILVHITYRRSSKDNGILKEMHFYLSDDRQHDTLFVQHCFLLHNEWLKSQGLKFKRHYVWSDGAASQFKAARPFYFVGRYYQLTKVEMTWNFFGSGHGKGEHDGAGGNIKSALAHEQLKPNGATLRCASDVTEFLVKIMPYHPPSALGEKPQEVSRKFWLVKIGDVDRSNAWACETVQGSRSIHSICAYCRHDPTEVKTRSLSCFCSACVAGHWRSCSNKSYVQKWSHIKLKPNPSSEPEQANNLDEESHDIPMFEGSLCMLGDLLNVGDNYAVNAEADNAEGVEFYVLKCVKSKWKTDKVIRDAWKSTCARGTYVVTGYYYKQEKDNPQHYKLLDTMGVSHMYNHLVRAIKFEMPIVDAATNTYYLSPMWSELIYNAMPYE